MRAFRRGQDTERALTAVTECLESLNTHCMRGVATGLDAMTRALSRHDVKIGSGSLTRSGGGNVIDAILKFGAEFEADLLVVGCYGHSRLRETVFGGATTRILSTMTLPVLMAH